MANQSTCEDVNMPGPSDFGSFANNILQTSEITTISPIVKPAGEYHMRTEVKKTTVINGTPSTSTSTVFRSSKMSSFTKTTEGTSSQIKEFQALAQR